MKNDAVAGLVADKAPPRSLGWSVAAGAGLGAIGFGLNQFPAPSALMPTFCSAVLSCSLVSGSTGVAWRPLLPASSRAMPRFRCGGIPGPG